MFRILIIVVSISLFSLYFSVGSIKKPQSINMRTETKIGYISNIDIYERTFDFDPIEWITMDNAKRIKELGLDEKTDFPNGFYRYNPTVDTVKCKVAGNAVFEYLNWKDNFTPAPATFEEFTGQHNEFFATFFEPLEESFTNYTPYWVEFKDGAVINVHQQYVA